MKKLQPLMFSLMTIFFLSSFTTSNPKNSNPVAEAMGWFWGVKCNKLESTNANNVQIMEIECCKRRFGFKFDCRTNDFDEQ